MRRPRWAGPAPRQVARRRLPLESELTGGSRAWTPSRPPFRPVPSFPSGTSPPGRELLHDGENALELGAPGLEVGLEEQLGEAGLGVALDVLANLGERAP